MRKKNSILIIVMTIFTLMIATSCLGKTPTKENQSDGNEKKPTKASDVVVSIDVTPENYPRIDGSTSTLRLVQEIYKEVFKYVGCEQSDLPQKASKTVPSYEKLISNQVDMIFVPYASQEVLDKAHKAGVELEFHPVSIEALIFITAKDNSTQNISKQQVEKIYIDYGINNWKELGGPDKELIPLCRNADSGSQSQMDNLVLMGKPMNEKIKNNFVELTMDGLLEQAEFYQNVSKSDCFGLGYTLYYYLQNMGNVTGIDKALKILSYEGIVATPETIADGSYPLATRYYAVVRSDLPKEHSARSLIHWLSSKYGSECINKSGLTPLSKVN
ncbi:substrate-binding domain-containing protein [Clostridium sp. CS001]|uniref:PstS family phosphate ABC transporter substrate-binding protein n=1 Tax=Clostridium sp. CS001 TaxID=2880648 RepID=UPI001CF35217|nr:substrate-binding domain-containing protein [Clostridium sp. CS001]MCB2289717.1 substrate-binding domain-containing protein [Clostridium sp. CS001]